MHRQNVLSSLDGINDCIIIKHSENQGRAHARNSGISKATGKILLFLDCDMEINNDFIFQHALIHKKRDVIGVHSKILPPKTIKLNNKLLKISHGSPWSPFDYIYSNSSDEKFLKFNSCKEDIFILGNTHHQMNIKKYSKVILEVRGRGLLKGLKLSVDNTKFIETLIKYKMLVVKAEEQVIRLFPALIVSKKEIDEAISKIDKTCKEMS